MSHRSNFCTALSLASGDGARTHRHFNRRVAYQLLDLLEDNAPHRKVAAVGVAQIVPADAALWTADARHAQRPQERMLGHPSSERLAVQLAEHVRAA